MSIDSLLGALQNTEFSHRIAKADHLFMAGLQVIHVLGFILLLASLVLLCLRLLRLVFNEQSLSRLAQELTRLLWLGLALAVLSGLLMFIGAPRHYFYNPAFLVKMVLLGLAVLLQATVFRALASSEAPRPIVTRIGVAAALLVWFSVSLAGRAIGFV